MRDPFNVTWIEQQVIMAGSIPTDVLDILFLRTMGIHAILSLTRRTLDCPGMAETLECVSYLHYPIPDGSVPDDATVQTALKFIDTAVSEHKPLFVHCRMGHGRTGEILIAYYMLYRGLSQADAQARLAVRYNEHGNAGSLSVPEQRAWIEMLAKQ